MSDSDRTKGDHIKRPSETTIWATRLYNAATELVVRASLYSEPACSAAARWLSEDAEEAREAGDEDDAQALWALAEVLLCNVNDLEEPEVPPDPRCDICNQPASHVGRSSEGLPL